MIGPDTAGRHDVRLDRLAVISIALAVFAQESVWRFYDAQVPRSLWDYRPSTGATAGQLAAIDALDTGLRGGPEP